MLTKLAELAGKKEQVNIAFTKGKNFYLLGIAPKGAGNDKLAPLVIKGTIDEINKQLDEKLPAYIEACCKKPEPAKKPAKKKTVADKKPDKSNVDLDNQKQVCRVCGCTDSSPCPDGCSWIEKDLCSACAKNVPLKESDVKAPGKKEESQDQFVFDF